MVKRWAKARTTTQQFFRKYWLGTTVILVLTLVYFGPILIRIGTYSAGGDTMFNAWTLARDHHCILRQGCPSYVNGNIYFPHKDTMLYSETQLSAGLLTLPLHFIDPNPTFAFNVWMVASFFFTGWFMYLLVKRLSRGHEAISIFAGLIFEFAPHKMSAIWHLQSLSIFYLPLIVLLIIKFFDTAKRSYLAGTFISAVLLFYASWYQMFFGLAAIAILLAGVGIAKLVPPKKVLTVAGVILLAVLATVPLAKEYVRFSNSIKNPFNIGSQTHYSSSVVDYFIPEAGTLEGKLYAKLLPTARKIPYNLDSFSYHGILFYVLGITLWFMAWRQRRKDKQQFTWLTVLGLIAIVGLVFSLGPLLKIGDSYIYARLHDGTGLTVPTPYLLFDLAFPPIHFIRAVGRWTILVLFALCAALAYLPATIKKLKLKLRKERLIYGVITAVLLFELAPLHLVQMSKGQMFYNLKIPTAYKLIKNNPSIDDLIILDGKNSDPERLNFARFETVLWAGYHNKNIYNGYSGYNPPEYDKDYADLQDLDASDIPKFKQLGVKYVLIDKQLSTANPELIQNGRSLMKTVYEDDRYLLLKVT